MKRLSPKAREHEIRSARNSIRRRLASTRRQKRLKLEPPRYRRIAVPSVFNLSDHYDDAIAFFEDVRDSVLRRNELVLLDFLNCTEIHFDAGLMLTAEVDRCRSLRTRRGQPTLTGTYPQNNGVEIFLQAIGFFKLLGLRDNFGEITSKNATGRFIQIKSGVRDKGDYIGDLAQLVFGDVVQLDREASMNLFRGLVEAMNNVTKHAYDAELHRGHPVKKGQWWMAGYWDRQVREIGAFMYDQGVGIPATLPKHHKNRLGEISKALGLGTTDGELIKIATRLGETQTGRSWQGRGMADLKRFIDIVDDGHLRILSGRGNYLYIKNSDGISEHTSELSSHLGGTFIEWRISDQSLVTWQK